MKEDFVCGLDLSDVDGSKAALLKELGVSASKIDLGCSAETSEAFSSAIFATVRMCLIGKFSLEDASAFLNDLIKTCSGAAQITSDVMASLDIETLHNEQNNNSDETRSAEVTSGKQRETYVKLLSNLEKELNSELLTERLELDTLESLGQIKSTELFQKRYVKTRTKLFYKQNKFNMLREENEGYSKLITELNQETMGISPSQFVGNLKSLVGKFNLDPNRVIDILLEVIECQSESKKFLIEVMREFGVGSNIAQFLGFKLQHFKSFINVTRKTPESLLHVTAMLITDGVISCADIYNHLIPSDKEMNENYKKYLINCRQAARKLTAAVLNEAVAEENAKEVQSLQVAPEFGDNQKLGLLQQLLVMGDWKSVNEMLELLPVPCSYVMSFGDVAYHLCQLVHEIIDPVYKRVCRECALTGTPPASTSTTTSTQLSQSAPPLPLTKKEEKSQPIKAEAVEKQIKPATEYLDFHGVISDMLLTLGPSLSEDPFLYVKLARIATASLKESSEKAEKSGVERKVMQAWLKIMDACMFPALSLMNSSCFYPELLWGAVQYLPYHDRYHLYYLWKSQVYSADPLLILKKAEVTDRIKYLMKRLTKDTVKSIGRHIAKLAFCNPLVAFDHVIAQLQKYDNLNAPMADVLKLFSQLSIDVMIYTLVDELANPTKEKINQANASLSPWLNSLAVFIGLICKKYVFDTSGLLQYIANQLKAERNFDLVILKELLSKMSGVTVFEDITNDELFALGGGELLKSEAAYQGQVRACQKSSKRLKDTMVELNIAFPLCMLLANHRNSVVFKEGLEGHLKLIGSLYDQSQDCLVQMLEFLDLSQNLDEMASLPAFDELLANYGLSPDAAFSLSRIKFQRQINLKFEEMKQEERTKTEDGKLPDRIVVKKYKEAVDAVMETVMSASLPVLQAEPCTSLLFDHVTPQFYFTFWSLSLYDIRVPVDVYDKEVVKLNNQKTAIDARSDWSDSKKTKEKDKLTVMVDKMKEEQQKQLDHVTRVMFRLKSESKSWYPNRMAKNECVVRIQQFCLYQRCLFSASDAVFCALFIKIIHSLQAVNFSTILCFDRVFSDLINNVASFTENEVSRYGRFLYCMWEIILKWHSDKQIYDKECINYPGFFMTIRKDSNSAANKNEAILEYENFRHVCYKWQFKVARDLIQCLESGDYIQTRNTVILLTRMLPYFPKVTHLAAAIEKRVDKVRQEEKDSRPDLSSLCMAYVVKMKTQKSKLMNEEQFHDKSDRMKKQEKMKQNEAAVKKEAAQKAAAAVSRSSSVQKDAGSGDSKVANGTSSKRPATGDGGNASTNGTAEGKATGDGKGSTTASDSKKRKVEKSSEVAHSNNKSDTPKSSSGSVRLSSSSRGSSRDKSIEKTITLSATADSASPVRKRKHDDKKSDVPVDESAKKLKRKIVKDDS
ncbi:THO complex subunit 2-like isoform X3 [Convolutriloba macropyga]|uniref:THO complex subunit 2-like isoform X2 n=1 Tax=Convolutriloba macropyga TaxID=536237 RepID=UPI003F520056